MKMSQLLIACDESKLEFQNLDRCVKSVDFHHKKGTTISFGTTAKLSADAHLTEKLGIILWLDRAAVAAALARQEQAA